jgi:cell division protein FtsB
MPAHDYFLELGTLAAVGQITEAEDRELRTHCVECRDCRDAYADYSQIISRDLPNINPARHRLKRHFVHPASSEEIRERFLARARQQGARFSAEVEAERPQQEISRAIFAPIRLVGAVSTVAIVGTAIWIAANSRTLTQHQSQQIATLASSNQQLIAQLERETSAAQPSTAPAIEPAVDRQSADRQLEPALRAQIRSLTEQLQKSAKQTNVIEEQLAVLQLQNASLTGSHQQQQATIKDLQKQLADEKNASTSTLAALVEAQDRVRALNTAVKEGDERLAMEQQLAFVSSDVRQLMGARNLHIIDVHDVNPAGKTGKSFGRVFYAENQSLIFYAFDLPYSKSAKYTFQAWGQREGNENSVHTLGTFAVDSHEQHRWVLKVNNNAALQGIDSVFVTAETRDDSTMPKGKRLLYAYFAPQANHP